MKSFIDLHQSKKKDGFFPIEKRVCGMLKTELTFHQHNFHKTFPLKKIFGNQRFFFCMII